MRFVCFSFLIILFIKYLMKNQNKITIEHMRSYWVPTMGIKLLCIAFLGLFILQNYPAHATAWRKAPIIRLYDLSGQEVTLSVSDKMSVFLFLSPECFSCDRELFTAQSLQKNLQFQLIPICVGCNWREVKRILESLNINLTVYMGSENLKASWGIWEFPTAFLIDQNMKIVEKWQGKIAVDALEKEIANNSIVKTKRKKADGTNSPSACSDGVCY